LRADTPSTDDRIRPGTGGTAMPLLRIALVIAMFLIVFAASLIA
jgi:hypothetical protein